MVCDRRQVAFGMCQGACGEYMVVCGLVAGGKAGGRWQVTFEKRGVGIESSTRGRASD